MGDDGLVVGLSKMKAARVDPARRLSGGVETDLAPLENGGLVLAASDMFIGARHSLILPGPPFIEIDKTFNRQEGAGRCLSTWTFTITSKD
jgi:allantoicase